jgi:hypothetical protein
MKFVLYGDRAKIYIRLVIVFLIMGLWFAYMIWGVRLERRTVLMGFIPEWTTYFAVGVFIGAIFAARAIYVTCILNSGQPSGKILESFASGFCLGFVCSLNIYAVLTYLLPGKIIQYESAYEVRYPGPSHGRSGSCEAGLWLRDTNTQSWIQLCTSKSELRDKMKKGTNALWVTAYTNQVGSYIMNYEFFIK